MEAGWMGEHGRLVGRRGLLGAAAAGTAAAAIPAWPVAAASPSRRSAHHLDHVPVAVPDDHALHVLRRLGYGPTPGDLAAVRKSGVARWVDSQLSGTSPDVHETLIGAMFPFLSNSPKEVEDLYSGDSQTAIAAYEWATLHRAMYSEQQVRARLTEVWLDHFNVCSLVDKPFLPWARFSYDFQVVRPRATGTFVDLLKAVLVSPAMLTFLDQWTSNKTYPVENLARENLELHTVGVGHFDERDVKAYAKLLTGATINTRTLEYEYRPELHYTGRLEILGFKAANRTPNGERLIGQFAEYLAHRPTTARNVARRLLVHYVSDRPSRSLVDRVARHYLRQHTDIAATLRFIIDQPEFFASRGKKTRRPGDSFAAAVRGLGLTWTGIDLGVATGTLIKAWSPYISLLRDAGHVPSEWFAPNGYPQVAQPWLNSNTTLQVWRLMALLVQAGNGAPFVKGLGPSADVWRPGMTYDGVIAATAQRITGQHMRPEHRHAIAKLAGVEPQEKPNLGWRLGGTAPHRAIEFGILASEYMVLR
ncbi:MAG TPA: DUF1800 domain-containing protein [Mycobacteriales bacterium]|nr:DUF1800 domain-containing protein [Mycobacteriales bacterium]